MADNITLNPGSGGSVVATDEVAGVHLQRVKVGFGVDGSYTDVSSTAPLPVVQTQASTASAPSSFSSLSSAVLQAANASRKGFVLTNEGPGILYILFGTGTASITNYSVRVPSGGYWECPYGFTGQLTAIYGTNGIARCQELL